MQGTRHRQVCYLEQGKMIGRMPLGAPLLSPVALMVVKDNIFSH